MTSPAIAHTLSDYIGEAERLRLENQKLRRMITETLIWIAEREDLLALAEAEIAQRWLQGRAA